MIVDEICMLFDAAMENPVALAVGLDYSVQLAAVPLEDGRSAIVGQLIFCCDSPIVGAGRLWEVLPPLAVDVLLDERAVRNIVLSVASGFGVARDQMLSVGGLP